MANLIINRTREVELGAETLIKGMWKIEVVCPNGEIKKPFGDEWRPNLLMRRGLEQLSGGVSSFSTIAQLMNTAQYGNTTLSPTDRTLYNGIVNTTNYNSIQNDGQNGIFGYSSFSSVGGAGNIVTDNLNTGSRTFQKTYDFLATPNQQTVKEILITDWNGDNTRGTGVAGSNMLSRFILPSPVVLAQYQFLRLTYALQVTIPAITQAGEINIDVQSGSFNGLGRLRLVGLFNDIFGGMNATGQPQAATCRNGCGEAFADKRLPWCIVGIAAAVKTFGTLIPGGDIGGTAQFDFPAVNTLISNTLVRQPGSEYVTTDGAGGSVVDLGLSNGNLSWTRGATLLFPATNPNLTDQYIGGIMFSTRAPGGNCQGLLPSAPNLDRSGWYWRFTDASGNRRGQLKDINFALAVNVQQTTSIT